MRVAVALLLAIGLAGCSNGAPGVPDAAPVADPTGFDEQIDEQIEATETTGVIRGVVVDGAIVPVPDVNVTVEGTGRATTTNAKGAFGFDGLEAGTYVLHADRRGFLNQTTLVSVVAGEDKPEVVKIVMDHDAEQVPYVQPYQFAGFMDCGTPAVEPCAAPNQIGRALGMGNITQDKTVFDLTFDRAPHWLQGELIWTGTQPLADTFSFCFQHPGETQPPPEPDPSDPVGTAIGAAAWLLFDSGASAQWIRCGLSGSPVVIAMDHNATLENELGARGVQMQVYGGHSEDVHDPTGFGLNTLVGLQLQQDFDVFAHAFYNWLPPEGWAFVEDGPPGDPPL